MLLHLKVITARAVSKYNTQQPNIAVNIFFVNKDGEIALLLRKNTAWMNNYYSLPGGKVELGESMMSAVVRESEEEVGVEVSKNDLQHALTVHINSNEEDTDMKWVYTIFEVHSWAGQLCNNEPDLHSELLWSSPDKLPENMIPSMRACVEAWKNERSYIEHGWK